MQKLSVTKVAHFSGHKDAVFSLEKSLNPLCFYSGAADGYIVEWNYETKGDGKLIVQVNRPVYSLFLNRDSKQLFAGTAAGNMHVIDLESGKEIRNIEAHTLGLFDIKQAGDQLITAGGDGIICTWDLSTLELLQKVKASDKSARVLSVHPSVSRIAAGFSDHKIRIYDTLPLRLHHTIDAHTNSVFALSWAEDGTLLSGGRDVKLRSWNPAKGYSLEQDIPAHNLHINALAFNPSKELFATVSMDKTIKIWDSETFTLLKVIDKVKNEAHLFSVNKLLWIDNTHLLTCSDDKTIMLWGLAAW